jgi:DnaK suppressor protein
MIHQAVIKARIKEEISATQVFILQYRELIKTIAPENAIGRNSRMDAINNKTVNEHALRKFELKLKNHKMAHTKLDDVDFGMCVKCHRPIPFGSILLMPQTIVYLRCTKYY